MIDRLEAIKKRYEELTMQLSSEEVLSDYNTLMKLSILRTPIIIKKKLNLIDVNV